MRRQGIWTKIVALFMLIALMAPVSVRAALCFTNPVGMRCCMKEPPTVEKSAKELKPSCCRQKDPVLSAGPTATTDDSCKCVIKTLPKDLQADLKATTFAISHQIDEAIVSVPSFPRRDFHDVDETSICLFLSDSSPPRAGVTASVFGRAPPVN